MMKNKVNEELVARLREFIENEMRSCSMDLAGITPEYVQRMWGGTVSLEDIEAADRLCERSDLEVQRGGD